MPAKIGVTELKLRDALMRLIHRKPSILKSSGTITLNKINNEAGLGHSYVYKFPDFISYALPIIQKHNEEKDLEHSGTIENKKLDSYENLKKQLQREKRLKETYRLERDNAKVILKQLQSHNSTLMFRLYELQDELSSNNVSYISVKKKNN
jgi:hypothetical protein